MRRGSILLAVAIVAVFVAAASNVKETVDSSHWRKHDRKAFLTWVHTHGGRRSYGVGIAEVHSKYDIVCTAHFPSPGRRHGADYRLFLLVDSHGSGEPRVVRAARGPLKVKPTATGPKCGAMPRIP